MNDFPGRYAWVLGLLAIVLIVAAGAIGYDAGVSQGAAQAATMASGNYTPPAYDAHGWHRPWGAFFPIFPLLFIFVWIALARVFWWGGGPRWRWYGYPPFDRERFDEWHRRAHDQMKS